jgi:hypothetical protein
VAARYPTATRRSLPSFFIIGAQKAGTSSLFAWLRASPGFVAPLMKEVHYFTLHHDKSLAWYRSHFPLRRRLGDTGQTGEATPYMLFHPDAARRTAGCLPQARFVVLLRDPVNRAWSHYWYERRKGLEPLSFEAAIAHELERTGTDPWAHQHLSYLARSRYAEQLERWFRHFPRARFLVLRSEDAFAEPQATTDRVCRWLGLRTGAVPSRAVALNVGRYEHGMDPGLRRELQSYFADDQRRLRALLGWCAVSS